MSAASQSLTVHVPLAIRHRRGRKIIVTPAGVPAHAVSRTSRGGPTLVKALARVFRWKRLLENGTYASISEMAAAEKLDRGYLGRVLLLTLLAPDIVEAILDGTQPAGLSLPELLKPFPLLWERQRSTWLTAGEQPQAAAPRVTSQPQHRAQAADPDASTPAWISL